MGRVVRDKYAGSTAGLLGLSPLPLPERACMPGTQLALVGCALFAAAAIVLVGEAARAGGVDATLEMPSES